MAEQVVWVRLFQHANAAAADDGVVAAPARVDPPTSLFRTFAADAERDPIECQPGEA